MNLMVTIKCNLIVRSHIYKFSCHESILKCDDPTEESQHMHIGSIHLVYTCTIINQVDLLTLGA